MIDLTGSRIDTLPDNLLGEGPVVVLIRNCDDLNCTYASTNIQDLLGYSPNSFRNNSSIWLDNIHADDKARVLEMISALKFDSRTICYYRFRNQFGEYRWLRDDLVKKPATSTKAERIISSWLDVTDYKTMERRLRLEQAHLAEVQQIAQLGSWKWKRKGNMFLCSLEICRIFAIHPEESTEIGFFLKKIHKEDRQRVFTALREAILNRTDLSLDYRIGLSDGSSRHVQQKMTIETDSSSQLVSITGILQDITERKRVEHELIRQRSSMAYLAHHDSLTNLPNRICIQDWMQKALQRAARDNYEIAVLLIDIDNFKMVNDNYGHQIGDKFLVQFSQRLVDSIDQKMLIGRLSGDEFVIIIDPLSATENISQLARQVLSHFTTPFNVDGLQFFLTPSIGISLFSRHGKSFEELLRTADVAMYAAKKERNTYRIYTPEMDARSKDFHTISNELRKALTEQEFELFFHPQVDLRTGQLLKLEALLRWKHPEKGLISPLEFIPVAEETGLILPIGDWVLDSACEQAKKFLDAGIDQFCMSINISMVQFKQAQFPETVISALNRHKLDPNLFELEITESIAMENPELTISHLNKIRAQGIRVAIDDFGTGHSSLSHLKHLPISTLKIDRGFVTDVMTDHFDSALIKTVVELAETLNLEVVVEGIETEEQRQFLSKLGCQIGQGFLFCKPLPSDLLIPQYADIKAAWCPIIRDEQTRPAPKRLFSIVRQQAS